MENYRGTVRFSGRPCFFVAFGVKKKKRKKKKSERKNREEERKKIRVRQEARQSNRPGINDAAWNNGRGARGASGYEKREKTKRERERERKKIKRGESDFLAEKSAWCLRGVVARARS